MSKPAAVEAELAEKVPAEELASAQSAWNGTSANFYTPTPAPVLPKADKRNILITSALPYVNNVPHLGNIIGCVLSADCFARYARLRGYNTLFVCGTDEYGTATETKALEEGVTPQQICDKYYKLHAEVYQWFNISFDHFGRTTTPKHTRIAQDIFLDCHKNNFLITQDVQQLKCLNCDRFLADRYVEGTCPGCGYDDARGDQCDKCQKLINATELIRPRCKTCSQAPVITTSTHLYLDLPNLESELKDWYTDLKQKSPWSRTAQGIMKGWFDEGIQPRCVTRDLKWGTPVPLDEYKDKVLYVWFDAPIGYVSITANYTDEWKQWWLNPANVELYQFMAKDNVTFHGVIFPGSLLATRQPWTMVKMISSVEYLNYEDTKFSKSRGIGVFGTDTVATGIPADVWRFYLLFVRPEGQDSAFSWSDLQQVNNSILLNNIGNFVHRSLTFVANTFAKKVPEAKPNEEDFNMIALVNRELKAYYENMEQCRLREALKNAIQISKLGNQYIQEHQPWKLAKDPATMERCSTVVSLGANLVYLLASLLEPYIPEATDKIAACLNLGKCTLPGPNFIPGIPVGHEINEPHTLFTKMENAAVEANKVRFAGKQSDREKSGKMEERPPADPAKVAELEAKIKEVGDKVRLLKLDGAEKTVIDTEVTNLLALKKEMAKLVPPAPGAKKGKKK
eukprot:comp12640_c0_seq1/m.7691 comp12640_c0_seq1/g.7691  ORF comp12640_c0_seq1/g.7691 comp12640_c0_seq1/m.7691 type:complete len:681 (-) comp12640_c0_seq1:697-2739(-)